MLLAACSAAAASEPAQTVEFVGTPASLLPAEGARRLDSILPMDRQVRWKVFVPSDAARSGVLVFVHPSASADRPEDWTRVLQEKNLIWICAESFGNDVPSAQRVLASLLGLAHVQQTHDVDSKRIYIAGMSGGGRIASQAITRFPRLFTGAIYIVGADPWSKAEEPFLEQIAANRYVFLTGHDDFNRQEMKRVYGRYRRAGIEGALLLDLPDFGHEYPSAEVLERAIHFLDEGVEASTHSAK